MSFQLFLHRQFFQYPILKWICRIKASYAHNDFQFYLVVTLNKSYADVVIAFMKQNKLTLLV